MAHGTKNSGKTERFLALYHAEHPRLYGMIRALLPRREDADEVFQEACIALWQNFDDFQPDSNFSAWAATIARHRILAYRKRKGRSPAQFSDGVLAQLAEDFEQDLTYFEARRQALSTCVDQLRAADRDLLRQRLAHSGPVAEVAGQIGRPLESVYKSLQRIRRQLQACVQRKFRRADDVLREETP